MQGPSSDLKQFFLVKNNLFTSVHNDTNDADNYNRAIGIYDADNYNRAIGIAPMKAFSCIKKEKKESIER